MNFGELKNEIRDLGFEESEAIEEYLDIVASATNRALHIINSTTVPVTARYEFTQTGQDGMKRYDLIELTKQDGKRRFLSVDEMLLGFDTFNNYELEQGHILVMDGSVEGDFTVIYKVLPARVNSATEDSTGLDIDARVEPLLPLLVAHYVWLDDDERKSTQYYNEYDSIKEELMGNFTEVRARIWGGF